VNVDDRTHCQKRRALLQAASGVLTLLVVPPASARPLLKGDEPDAVTLEFVPDAGRLDSAAQPRFVAGSRCSRCYFFQGKASSHSAPCTMFAGYRVPATGWCRQFATRG
jgi:hypothetical protein